MTDDLLRVAELNAEYEILQELGRGGTAVVYLAREREPRRLVAIKIIRPSHIGDQESAARLVREARVVSGLQHPNIVVLYATRRLQDGSLALIMQYVAGRTLKHEVQEHGALTLERAEAVLIDLGRALAHAHGQRIVHRDIKPENVYVEDGTGIARLSDFGIARTWDADSGLTMPGTALGTPAYMAPEQIEGGALDGRSDLYSLGVVGWEILTGRRPWAGESLFSIIYKQKHEDLPSLTLLRPGISPRLLRAVEGALRKDPAERWSTAQEFLAVLSGYSVRSRARAEDAAPPLVNEPPPLVVVEPEDEERTLKIERDLDGTIHIDRDQDRTIELVRPPSFYEDPDATQAMTPRGQPIPPNPAVEPTPPPPPPAEPEPPKPAEAKIEPQDEEEEPRAAAKPRSSGSLHAVLAAFGLLILFAGAWFGLSTGDNGVEPPSRPSGRLAAAEVGADSVVRALPAVAFALIGATQRGAAGQALAEPLVVRVEDGQGKPVAGAAVRFEVTAGTGQIDPATTVTDSSGIATARWTLGGTGEQAVHATVQDMDSPPVEFHAVAENPSTARSQPPPSSRRANPTPPPAPTTSRRVARASAVSATTVEGTPGAALPTPLMVRATDASGRGVSGVRVQFTTRAGEGRVTPSTALTGADGTAAAEWVLGNANAQEVTARVDGSTSPIVFRATTSAAPFNARRDISAGGGHTCGIRAEGVAHCWGGNDYGQVGDGSTERRLTPVRVATPERLTALAAGSEHSCGLGASGAVYCWGNNAAGQLGDGTNRARLKPVRVVTSQRLQQIAVGMAHSCALDSAGRLYCWGQNGRGQIGDGSRTNREAPVRVGANRTFRSIALGWRHSCALTTDGTAYCWGSNGNGELGDANAADRLEPTAVVGGHRFVQLNAGSAHTCGLRGDGAVLCWGRNGKGELGNGSTEASSIPVIVQSVAPFSMISVGGEHACGITRSGAARCWGSNEDGQLGDGTTGNRTVPTPVDGEFRFTGISASATHTCAVTVSGDGYCWGFNLNGQLGDGTRSNQSRPIPVQR